MRAWTSLLEHLAAREQAAEPPDVAAIAKTEGLDAADVAAGLAELAAAGLASPPPIVVTDAGRQWIAGYRPSAAGLAFLPALVDDLRARDALAAATRTLTDEITEALAAGTAVAYVREIVPPAFAPAVDARLATRLAIALTAVITRLSTGRAAACVAEELMAVAVISEANSALADDVELGRLTEAERDAAVGATGGVFELFGDDDVLLLFDMSEPADAAISGHDATNVRLGVVDQRVEAWFDAFGGEPPLGHLRSGR